MPTTTEVSEADPDADADREAGRRSASGTTRSSRPTTQVLAWSRESSASADAPTRILDVRTAGEWVGTDLRAKRGGHIPGARNRLFSDLLTDEGTFRPVEEMLSIIRSSGVDPAEVRATYCQGGVRAALAWFVLHELAGFEDVRELRGIVGGMGQPPGQPDRGALSGAEPDAALPAAVLASLLAALPEVSFRPAARDAAPRARCPRHVPA